MSRRPKQKPQTIPIYTLAHLDLAKAKQIPILGKIGKKNQIIPLDILQTGCDFIGSHQSKKAGRA